MSLTETLQWANSLENEDGTAQYTDAKEAKASIDIDDVDPENIRDGEVDAQAQAEFMDSTKNVTSDTTHDIVGSVEDHEVALASGDAGGKVIEAFGIDPMSNAAKRFVISGFNAQTNPAAEAGDNLNACVILLQNGVIPEVGLNGVTAEDLLKVVEEIYLGFQEGKFACQENEEVLQHVRAAQGALQKRLGRRAAEGTEGTYEGN
jgi:hypothetical protein